MLEHLSIWKSFWQTRQKPLAGTPGEHFEEPDLENRRKKSQIIH
jgi:hypothetical protein